MRLRHALLFAALLPAAPAFAVQPDEQLADPGLEARARQLSQELRCLVCQNENIDESDAPLAHDLRVLLRERIRAGDSDDQVKAFLVARYGDFVLLKPPFEPGTWLLWLGPLLVLAAGGVGAGLYLKRRGALAPRPLTGEEDAEVNRLLDGRT